MEKFKEVDELMQYIADDLLKDHKEKDIIVEGMKMYAEAYHKLKSNLYIVSRPFKTRFQLAEFMHNEYEKHAQKTGWNTQETCKVEFLDLPKENKKTMLLVAESVLNAY